MKNKKYIFGILACIVLFFGISRVPFVRAGFGAWVAYVANTFNFNSQGSALVAQEFTYTQVNTTNSTTSVKVGSGLLHSLTIDTPATSSVITVYDDAATSTVITATSTNATATITVGTSSYPSSSATGTFVSVVNGFTVFSTSTPSGSSSSTVASNLAIAINASTSVVGATAATSSNVITLTANTAGIPLTLSAISWQYGLPFVTATGTFVTQTPVIAKITLPGTLLNQGPVTALFDVNYLYGLLVTQTGGTSTLTVSSY